MDTNANRNDLKKYFLIGSKPTAEQFAQLIDSVPNILEDGTVAFGKNGFAIFSKENKGDDDVLEIYSKHPVQSGDEPNWKFHLDGDGGLSIRGKDDKRFITFSEKDGVVIEQKFTVKSESTFSGDMLLKNHIIFNNDAKFTDDYKRVILYSHVYSIPKGQTQIMFQFDSNCMMAKSLNIDISSKYLHASYQAILGANDKLYFDVKSFYQYGEMGKFSVLYKDQERTLKIVNKDDATVEYKIVVTDGTYLNNIIDNG